MVITTRPLLYLSLPGIALIIGFIYFRRQKKSRDGKDYSTDDNNSDLLLNEKSSSMVKFNDKNLTKDHGSNEKQSISINVTTKKNYDMETETKFGKSAPIDITYTGGKSFTTKFMNNNSVGIEDDDDEDDIDNDFRHCDSPIIQKDDDDDSYLSSVDLPDSPNKKKRLMMTENCNENVMMANGICSVEEPVIIKATVSPNISLSNSFPENKNYTEKDENNEAIEDDITEEKTEQIDEKNKIDNDNLATKTTITVATTSTAVTTENYNETSNQNLSPPISEFSAHSGDSGKGSSLPRSERLKTITYDFMLPASLIGRFCGRRRSNIYQLKSKSGVNLILKKHNITSRLKICSLMGTEKEIKIALSLIRSKFPLKRFPHLTLQKIEYAEPQTIVPLPLDYTSCLQLRLIEGINNDVIVVSIMTGNHIFVHHPSHPSYPSINVLQNFINRSYETGEAPTLPQLTDNAICVAKVNNIWYRVQIVYNDNKEEKCLIKFLDYGGYTYIGIENLRQIRADFMTMPFQATECLLSNIEPIGSEWSQEAIETLCHLTAGLVLQAQIVRYSNTNLPEVNLYAPLTKNSVIFINKEMVARGFAKWTTTEN